MCFCLGYEYGDRGFGGGFDPLGGSFGGFGGDTGGGFMADEKTKSSEKKVSYFQSQLFIIISHYAYLVCSQEIAKPFFHLQ